MKPMFIIAALAGMVTAMPIMAQQPSPQMQQALRDKMQERMRETDTDGDGAISHAEFIGQAEARFKTADLNGNGKITADEFDQLRRKLMQQALSRSAGAPAGK